MSNIHRDKPARAANIAKKTNYRDYKSALRSDFNSRCGYCDDDDLFLGGKRGYHIDHFAPQSKFGELETEYSNLIYSCPFCNISKSNDWPSNDASENIVGNEGYIDPCDAEYDNHLYRNESGKIIPSTELGNYIHTKLKLNLMRHEMIWKYGQIRELIEKLEEVADNDETLLKLHQEMSQLQNLIIEEES